MISRLIKLTVFITVLLVCAAVAGTAYLYQWSDAKLTLPTEVVVDFPKGTSLTNLAELLEQQGVVKPAELFRIWVKVNGNYGRFQAGKYRFEGDQSPGDVIRAMVAGDVYRPVILRYTIPEGFNLTQITERLAANGVGHIKELRRLVKDASFARSLNVPADTLEGYLYPATYSFTEMPSAPYALKHMVETFWEKLPDDYLDRVKEKGLSLEEAVAFASLIELETKFDDERTKVSEVIWNRLKDGSPLGIDAAVIYGIEDYDGDIKWKHLKDSKNPYNLRIHKGLPPTPIGSPSVSSLMAVLTPTNEGHYYYVLVPGSDRHHFSKTLQEHKKYVRKLIDATRRTDKRK